ncbi:MAG: ABC transporter ATP-binding protein [Tepidisphaerales bacterium]
MAAHELEDDTFSGRFNPALWRKVLAFAWPHRGKVLAVAVLGVVLAAFDIAVGRLTGAVVDAARSADPAEIRAVFVGYGLLMLAFAAGIYAFIRVTGRITCDVSYDLRKAAFAHLQSLGFAFYDRKAVGWLMARLTSDVATLSRVMSWAILDIVWGVSCVVLVTAAMLYLNWRLALLVLVILPPLLLVSLWFQKRLLATSRAMRKTGSQLTASYNEALLGLRTTRSMNREHRNLEEFSGLAGTMYGHSLRNTIYAALFVPLLSSICFAAVALALYRGGYDVAAGTGFTLGQLVAFTSWATFLQWPVMLLAQQLTAVQAAQASAERVVSLLDTAPDITDGPDVLPQGLSGRVSEVRFEHVTFGYDPQRPVLHDVSFTAGPGQCVALVGPTGGGKSTIVSLACRFYQPTSGRVLINGIDYTRLPLRDLQRRLGIVLQQPHLFSGTIAENIRYGRLDATDAEVERAARLAGAHDFIAAFPDGYATRVGEGGSRLSTGQKQLISLARAIIADPEIFIMDEATSSVDTATERAIQAAVDRVLKGRISFVIAHRLSTIRRADLILVIADGRIVEQGDHASLIARRGRYHALYTQQFTAEHEEQLLRGPDAETAGTTTATV